MAYLVDGVQFLGVQIPLSNVGANLEAGELQLTHCPLDLLHGEGRGVHGKSAETNKPARVGRHSGRQVIVEEPGDLQCVLGLGLIEILS